MKKILLFAASAAAILCSCNKEQEGKSLEASALDGETPIVFDNYVNQTKSTTLNADSVKTLGFGVFAFSQEQVTLKEYAKANYVPNFMYNQQVTNDGTGWKYSPVKYWPNNPGAMVSFFAYAPYISKLNEDKYTITPDTNTYLQEVVPTTPECLRLVLGYDHNGPGIEYNLPADPTYGVDLMWGQEKGQTYCPCDKKKPSVGEKIQFQFKHALSRLDFDLQVVVDDTTGTPNNNALAKGTKIKVKSVALKGNFASKGTLRLYDGTWNISNTDYTNIVFSEGMNQFADTVENYITDSLAIEPVALLKGEHYTGEKNNYLMLIPGAKFFIEIVYEVTTTDAANPKNNSVVTNTIRSYDSNAKVTPAAADGYFTIKQGNAYTFHLVLGMTSVKFDADVEPWVELGNEYVVDLPENYPTN